MRTQRWVMGCLLVVLPALPASAAVSNPVKTDLGRVRGSMSGDVMVFKGIPYAAPPVGPLRWQPPQPAAPWTVVLPAEKFSASCMQRVQDQLPWTDEYNIGPPYSEDCLYLNVWTAARSSQDRRPVLFWIYGGGFDHGSGSVPIYDGTNLARKGLVVVTFNYRVGVFGFLAHPDLSAESAHHASGNYGLLDIVAALEWVRHNIAAFGGDPNCVTIAGQSAGASAVHQLVASPLARGFFERAIAESGSGVGRRGQSLADAERAGANWAKAKGVHSVAELRQLPATDLMTERAADHTRFGPVVDGWVLPGDPETIIASGHQNDVPTLTGVTADDNGVSRQSGQVTVASFHREAESRFGLDATEFLALYPADADTEAQAADRQSGRAQLLISMYLWAQERAASAKTAAYTYEFTRVTPGPIGARFGAFHASDIVYFFDNLDRSPCPWTTQDRQLTTILSSYWVQFARTGSPNGPGLPPWPAFDAADPQTMELGARAAPRPVATPPELNFFKKHIVEQRGAIPQKGPAQ